MRSKARKMLKMKSLFQQPKENARKNSWSSRRSSRKNSIVNSMCSFKISKIKTGIYSVQITDSEKKFTLKGNYILQITKENAEFNKTLPESKTPYILIGKTHFLFLINFLLI